MANPPTSWWNRPIFGSGTPAPEAGGGGGGGGGTAAPAPDPAPDPAQVAHEERNAASARATQAERDTAAAAARTRRQGASPPNTVDRAGQAFVGGISPGLAYSHEAARVADVERAGDPDLQGTQPPAHVAPPTGSGGGGGGGNRARGNGRLSEADQLNQRQLDKIRAPNNTSSSSGKGGADAAIIAKKKGGLDSMLADVTGAGGSRDKPPSQGFAKGGRAKKFAEGGSVLSRDGATPTRSGQFPRGARDAAEWRDGKVPQGLRSSRANAARMDEAKEVSGPVPGPYPPAPRLPGYAKGGQVMGYAKGGLVRHAAPWSLGGSPKGAGTTKYSKKGK